VDGLGIGHLSSLALNTNHSFIGKFDSYGYLNSTNSSKKWLPDEAYTASSIATGYCVPKNRVSQDSSGKDLYTFFDLAHQYSKKSGLITTASLSYITPACFTVHSRYWKDEVNYAKKQFETDLDLLLGGGKSYFQSDKYNLKNKFAQNGRTLIDTLKALDSLTNSDKKLIGFFSDKELPAPQKRKTSLNRLVQRSLDHLSNKNGFVLLINDTHLDWYTHQEKYSNLISEMKVLNKTVNSVLDYQNSHSNTLALLIGSHDCGGIAPLQSLESQNKYSLGQLSENHTGNFSPVFASGKFHSKFDDFFKPYELGKLIKNLTIQ